MVRDKPGYCIALHLLQAKYNHQSGRPWPFPNFFSLESGNSLSYLLWTTFSTFHIPEPTTLLMTEQNLISEQPWPSELHTYSPPSSNLQVQIFQPHSMTLTSAPRTQEDSTRECPTLHGKQQNLISEQPLSLHPYPSSSSNLPTSHGDFNICSAEDSTGEHPTLHGKQQNMYPLQVQFCQTRTVTLASALRRTPQENAPHSMVSNKGEGYGCQE